MQLHEVHLNIYIYIHLRKRNVHGERIETRNGYGMSLNGWNGHTHPYEEFKLVVVETRPYDYNI